MTDVTRTLLEVTNLKKYFPIRKGLFSRTVGYVRAVDGVSFSVKQGEVTLTGTIDDRETKRMAEDCVLQCSGVRDVHNQLRIHR